MKYTIRFYDKDSGKQFAYYVTQKKSEADSIMRQKWSRADVKLEEENYEYDSGLQY